MSIEAQKMGYKAEQRVLDIASKNGLNARAGTLAEDHASKVDVFIEGQPFQVSCGKKSKGERKRLENRGINSIAAGESVPEESVLTAILSFLKQ
ncbi:MAG TPA: hypothetical protein VKC54_02180 [Patescibacteria group bacterium]|nr:hypothetical protein [Patescibacteria group bacterium]